MATTHTYHLEEPSEQDVIVHVRRWREHCRESLRTTTVENVYTQRKFYDNVVSNPESHHRYWSCVDEKGLFCGFVGLTYIDYVNGLAEISLITDPARRGEGIGTFAVKAVLQKAFHELRLHNVFGEVYACSPAYGWWTRLLEKMNAHSSNVVLPARKFWNGVFHNSLYFSFINDGSVNCYS